MSTLKRKFITVLAVLFCTLLCLSTALIIPKSDKTADAYVNDPSVTVDNLMNGSQNVFSAKSLRKLYSELADDDKVKNLKDLDTKLNITTSGVNSVASKNVIVEFGGMKWTAVYLSKATTEYASVGGAPAANTLGEAANEDIVLTLWLTNPTQTAKFNSSNDSSTFTTCTYASNMYGTSYMRTYVLNNGGYYWQDRENLTQTPHAQQSDNPYAHFTMTNPNNGNESVVDYLVSPRYIKWQYMQSAKPDHYSYELNNDSWGKGDKDNFFSKNNMKWYYADKFDGQPTDYYSIWKDDLIWLPSVTEAGSGTGTNGCGTNGMWNTTREQRLIQSTATCPWLRSADEQGYKNVFCVDGTTGDSSSGYFFMLVDSSRLVRPAIHLNLTEASKAAKGVSYDDVKASADIDEDTKEIEYGIDTNHTFSHVYDGNAVDITLNNRNNLQAITSSDYTTGSNYNSTNGKFTSGIFPEEHDKKAYEIKVKLKSGYVWDDTDTYEDRTYTIEIALADFDVGWEGFNAQLDDSLLLPNTEIGVQGNPSDAPLEVRYYIVEPNSTNSPPTDTSEWTLRDASSDPKVAAAGTYHVYYELKAKYHNTEKSSYNVSVGVDNVTITADGSAGSAIYCTGGTESTTQQNWIDKIKTAVSVTKNGQPYDSVDTLLGNLEVVLKTKNGNNYSDAVKNGQGYYNIGTYYLDLKYKDGASQAIQFVWANNDRPTFEIKQDTITVKVVADSADGLTHVYGDSHAAMKFELTSGGTTLPDGGELNDLEFGDYILKSGYNEVVLDERTPVSDGVVIADVSNIKNYKVQFETSGSAYSVKQREVKLKVVDKSLGYGEILNPSTVQLTFEDGESLKNNELLSDVIKSITPSIKSNAGVSFNLSEILPIAEYVLGATATADNYIFKITAGKLTITKANYVIPDGLLGSKGYIYDGEPHPAILDGDLPSDEIKVSYRYVNYDTGEELDGAPTEVGLYLVYASFSHNNSNYNPITEVKAAFIRIAYTQDELNQPYPPLPTDEELAAAADLAKKKAEAKKTLDEEAKKKKDEIDADVNLTPEEKKAAKDEIDEELKKGNEAIDKAKDKDGVNKAYDDGKKEMEDTAELVEKKGAAKSELDKAAQAKKDAIDNNPDLTDEEKQAAKDKVDEELAKGKAEINGATDISGVQSVESSTKTNIENIKPEHKGSFPWWILAVIAGALVLMTILIIVIVKRRNADDEDEFDDFYDDEYDYDEEEEIEEDDGGDEAFGF